MTAVALKRKDPEADRAKDYNHSGRSRRYWKTNSNDDRSAEKSPPIEKEGEQEQEQEQGFLDHPDLARAEAAGDLNETGDEQSPHDGMACSLHLEDLDIGDNGDSSVDVHAPHDSNFEARADKTERKSQRPPHAKSMGKIKAPHSEDLTPRRDFPPEKCKMGTSDMDNDGIPSKFWEATLPFHLKVLNNKRASY